MTTNVEVVRAFYDATNARDEAAFETLLTDDFEARSLFSNVEGHLYRGMDGVREYLRETAEAWSHFELVVEDLIAVGDDRVLALIHVDARGAASGVIIDPKLQPGQAALFVMRGQQVCRVQVYADRAAARAAAGLAD